LGQDAVEPLLGVLESDNAELRLYVIKILARLKTQLAVPHLLAPAYHTAEDARVQAAAREALRSLVGTLPPLHDAENFLWRKANDYFAGDLPRRPDADHVITLWRWSDERKASEPHHYPATAADVPSPELAAADGT